MNKILEKVFRVAGVNRWYGIRLVRKFIDYVLYRIFKPTNNEVINSVVVSLYIGALVELGEEIGRFVDEQRAFLWAQTKQPIESATIGWIGFASGVKPKDLSKAGLLDWAGIMVAKQVNGQLGTDFKTFYPPAKAKDGIVQYVQGAVMNSGAGGVIDGFSIMSASAAALLMRQIAENYNAKHNISLTAMEEKVREQRRKNVGYQKKYRQTHEQIGINMSPKSLIVQVGAEHALDDYYALYEAEKARRAAEKAAKEAAAAAAGGA